MTGNVAGGLGYVASSADYVTNMRGGDYRAARKSGVDMFMGAIMFKFPIGTVVGGIGLYVNHDYHAAQENP
jgi:hypothetical protein